MDLLKGQFLHDMVEFIRLGNTYAVIAWDSCKQAVLEDRELTPDEAEKVTECMEDAHVLAAAGPVDDDLVVNLANI
jgi:hypothetical protein